MLRCEAVGSTTRQIEDLAVFASQLATIGIGAGIDVGCLPEGLTRNAQFDLMPLLCEGAPGRGDSVVLVGAQSLNDGKLARLRRLAGSVDQTCVAFGAFESEQAMIGARSRLSYVFGKEPVILNTIDPSMPGPHPDAPVFGVERKSAVAARPRVLLIAPDLTDPPQASALVALSLSRQFHVSVLTDGKAKEAWTGSHGLDIPFYHYGEILPFALAERVDICVNYAPTLGSYRMRTLIANLTVSGAALIDGTPGHVFAQQFDSFIRGPINLPGLSSFILADILPNLRHIFVTTRSAKFTSRLSAAAVSQHLSVRPKPRTGRTAADLLGRVVFMPTNGVGLGHAQRCGLVARALDPARVRSVFAAFPSCMKLVKSCGFDVMPMIGRSGNHAQSHENDLVNGLRLRALTEQAQALVFDGGYVFDSVYRAIVENRARGVWIRRGLWQANQDNSVALDREKIFDRVIVPREAFDELNTTYSRGDHVHEVGPIVRRLELSAEHRAELRAGLAERYGIAFEKLVVTSLGAGVAADRSTEIHALSGMLARRDDTLHLVVVWPTSTLQPVWFDWRNTRVVKTLSAGLLTAAADVCVSAAGYNSWHEALYNRIPTIFVPQTGAFMDDQQARARAARDRGVASMVEPNALMALERELGRHLDDGKQQSMRAKLAALALPETGTRRAARLIEEVMDDAAMEFDRGTYRTAGRR